MGLQAFIKKENRTIPVTLLRQKKGTALGTVPNIILK